MVFNYYGISPSQLIWSYGYWTSDAADLHSPSGCTAGSPGCTVLNGSQQVDIQEQAAAAYWWVLVMSLVVDVYLCKSRNAYLFQRRMFFNNVIMIYGVAIQVALVIIFMFTPGLNSLLIGQPFPGPFWPIFLLSWLTIILIAESRKFYCHRYPDSRWARIINW